MKKIVFLILIVLQFSNLKSQDKMELYRQQQGDLIVTYEQTNGEDYYYWHTKIINTKSKKELTLRTDSLSSQANTYKRSNILSVLFNGNDIYIIHYWIGRVTFYHYYFINSNDFKVTSIQLHLFTDYGVGGDVGYTSKIGNKVYFYLYTRANESSWDFVDLYSLDLKTSELRKIEFTNQRYFYTVYLDESDKEYYLDESNIEPSKAEEESEKRFIKRRNEIIANYCDQPYYIKELSSQKEERDEQSSYLTSKLGLNEYDFFESTNLSDKKQFHKEAEERIKEILKSVGLNENIKLLDSLVYRSKDFGGNNLARLMVFLYKDANNGINIIRYNVTQNYWILGDYIEETIGVDSYLYK